MIPPIQAPIPTIPATAWEQAAIIAIFAVTALAFLGGLYLFLRSLLKQFTDFIEKRDKEYQETSAAREQAFNLRNGEVVNVLRELLDQFREHDARTQQAITTMQERTRPKPRTRKAAD